MNFVGRKTSSIWLVAALAALIVGAGYAALSYAAKAAPRCTGFFLEQECIDPEGPKGKAALWYALGGVVAIAIAAYLANRSSGRRWPAGWAVLTIAAYIGAEKLWDVMPFGDNHLLAMRAFGLAIAGCLAFAAITAGGLVRSLVIVGVATLAALLVAEAWPDVWPQTAAAVVLLTAFSAGGASHPGDAGDLPSRAPQNG